LAPLLVDRGADFSRPLVNLPCWSATRSIPTIGTWTPASRSAS